MFHHFKLIICCTPLEGKLDLNSHHHIRYQLMELEVVILAGEHADVSMSWVCCVYLCEIIDMA